MAERRVGGGCGVDGGGGVVGRWRVGPERPAGGGRMDDGCGMVGVFAPRRRLAVGAVGGAVGTGVFLLGGFVELGHLAGELEVDHA